MEALISAYVQYTTFFSLIGKTVLLLGAKFFVMRENEEFQQFQWAIRRILFRVLKYVCPHDPDILWLFLLCKYC